MIVFGNKVFDAHINEITAFNSQDLFDAFRKIDVLRKNKYVVGYIRYEAEKAFSGKKVTSDKPLLWFKVFDEYKIFKIPEIKDYRTYIKVNPKIDFKVFDSNISKIKDYIAEGRTYQVNYTFDCEAETILSDYDLFLFLLKLQKTQYCAYIENDYETILSFSPELFFETAGNKIRTKPMKGTIKTGKTGGIDNSLLLKNDGKNRAENLMIVDLLRNDLGKICKIGSIKVPKLFETEKYQTVYQMTSTVTGELRDDVTTMKLFEALFPCGSVTGAPKIETMKIIDRLEEGKRGIYCGALGYFSPDKTQFSVPIRILQKTKNDRNWKYRVGSGIVWDSTAKDEWDECKIKSSFLIKQNPTDFELIETMLCKGGSILFQKEHLQRLSDSARYFGFKFNTGIIFDKKKDSIIRLLLDNKGNTSIEYKKLETTLSSKIMISDSKINSRNLFLKYKTTFRPWYEEVQKEIIQKQLFDIIFFNEKGELCEGTRSNIFLEIDGKLYTPQLESGLLNGIFRQKMLEKNECLEKVIKIEDLTEANAIYCANSVRGLIKVELI